MIQGDKSIALLGEVDSESLDPLVELSGVLGHSVLHLELGVEGADDVELIGLHDARASLFFLRQRVLLSSSYLTGQYFWLQSLIPALFLATPRLLRASMRFTRSSTTMLCFTFGSFSSSISKLQAGNCLMGRLVPQMAPSWLMMQAVSATPPARTQSTQGLQASAIVDTIIKYLGEITQAIYSGGEVVGKKGGRGEGRGREERRAGEGRGQLGRRDQNLWSGVLDGKLYKIQRSVPAILLEVDVVVKPPLGLHVLEVQLNGEPTVPIRLPLRRLLPLLPVPLRLVYFLDVDVASRHPPLLLGVVGLRVAVPPGEGPFVPRRVGVVVEEVDHGGGGRGLVVVPLGLLDARGEGRFYPLVASDWTLHEVHLDILSIAALPRNWKTSPPLLLRGVASALSAALLLRRPVPEKPALLVLGDDHHLAILGWVVVVGVGLHANGGGFGGAGGSGGLFIGFSMGFPILEFGHFVAVGDLGLVLSVLEGGGVGEEVDGEAEGRGAGGGLLRIYEGLQLLLQHLVFPSELVDEL